MGIVVGIDASRNRSGGAKGHLIGVLGDSDPTQHGIQRVHVWSYRSLLEALPDRPWLRKHNPSELEGTLLRQAWWQLTALPGEVQREGCDILLNTDAGTIGNWRPCIAMSRDMLSYERGEMQRYGLSKAWFRLLLLRYIQARSLKRADGAIFLTNYAARTIQAIIGNLQRIAVIPHGVGSAFVQRGPRKRWPASPNEPVRCLYVSNTAMYKHQWVVVRAISELRKRGYNVTLRLAGGGSGRAQRLLDEEIARTDPQRRFIESLGHVRHQDVPGLLAAADLFVFASSCENMPNTLVEAMAAGLPIACSNRGPMPEVLQDGGVFFDPEDAGDIAAAVGRLIADAGLRARCAARARTFAQQYSWSRCGRETWGFIVDTFERLRERA